MRISWPLFAILPLLASLLVPRIASTSTAVGNGTRVGTFDLVTQVCLGVDAPLTREQRPGCELARYDFTSDPLLAARGGGRAVDAATPIGRRGNPMHVPRGTNSPTTRVWIRY